ncbi:MAG: hypothetical protein IJT77_10910, partial [Clostridia bacterium]|nr:hypothetical protein [Clostridia bacterium]
QSEIQSNISDRLVQHMPVQRIMWILILDYVGSSENAVDSLLQAGSFLLHPNDEINPWRSNTKAAFCVNHYRIAFGITRIEPEISLNSRMPITARRSSEEFQLFLMISNKLFLFILGQH